MLNIHERAHFDYHVDNYGCLINVIIQCMYLVIVTPFNVAIVHQSYLPISISVLQ